MRQASAAEPKLRDLTRRMGRIGDGGASCKKCGRDVMGVAEAVCQQENVKSVDAVVGGGVWDRRYSSERPAVGAEEPRGTFSLVIFQQLCDFRGKGCSRGLLLSSSALAEAIDRLWYGMYRIIPLTLIPAVRPPKDKLLTNGSLSRYLVTAHTNEVCPSTTRHCLLWYSHKRRDDFTVSSVLHSPTNHHPT